MTMKTKNYLVPVVPSDILQRHDVFLPMDNRFVSCARLLQSLWRQKRGLTLGSYKAESGLVTQLGSRLAPSHARAGLGFLSKEIAAVVYRQLVQREYGALYDENRLWGNLLSSQGLTFNLFGKAKHDPAFAKAMFGRMFPSIDGEIEDILFEHSPGRWTSEFIDDGTAFDLLVTFIDKKKRRSFVAIEVKYTEQMVRGGRKTHTRLDQLAQEAGLYKDPLAEALVKDPLAQLRAEHILANSMVRNGNFHQGYLCVVAPKGNREAWATVRNYEKHLANSPNTSTPFISISVEDCIDAIATAGDTELAFDLAERYIDLSPILNEIDKWKPYELADAKLSSDNISQQP